MSTFNIAVIATAALYLVFQAVMAVSHSYASKVTYKVLPMGLAFLLAVIATNMVKL